MKCRSFILNRVVVAPATAALLAVGCAASPTEPDGPAEVGAPLASGGPTIPGGPTVQAAAHPTPAQLTEHGWRCVVPPPTPGRIVCFRPNQPIPNPAIPVEDRPASFTVLVFDSSGVFLGTQIGVREDLYRGQICESTNAPYIHRSLIGYYECLHTVGG